MKRYRAGAYLLFLLAGICGGALLIIDWRMLALAVVCGWSLILGLSFWRLTVPIVEKGDKPWWSIRATPTILGPIILIAAGAALISWLVTL